MQSVHVTTKVVSFNLDHGEGYSIQFVNDSREACGFQRVLQVSSVHKLPRYSWNIVESGVKHNIPNPSISWSTADPLVHFRFDSNIMRCLYTGYFDYDGQMVSGLARTMERSTELTILCRYFHKEPCKKSEDNCIANRKFTR